MGKNIGYDTIAYVGSQLPSLSETFVYNELLAVQKFGQPVISISVYRPSSTGLTNNLLAMADQAFVVYSGVGWCNSFLEVLLHPVRSLRTIARGIADAAVSKDYRASRWKVAIQAVASLGLARRLRTERVRHLHAHMANTPTSIAMYTSMQLGVPFSFTGHANDLFVHRSLLAEKLQRASFVACISEWHRRFYQSIVPLDHDRLPIIRCGVDIPPLEMSAHQSDTSKVESTVPFRILSVGRLVDKKGMDTLIRAIALIDPNHLFRCDIIGDGPLKPMLVELIETLGLRERVVLRGACPNTEVLEAVRQCDVFVLACQRDAVTDDQDGIPVSLMEAMAQSKCVITTNLDPITELVIHERTGWMVPPRDPEALAMAIQQLMTDSVLCSYLATAGRSHVEQEFSRFGNAEKLVDCFQRC
jgi:colanic acid/amylovoran biosynthesis glycosyltransferase